MEKITGICFWAFVNHPNTKFDDQGKYSIDLECDKPTVAKLKKLGINLLEKEDGRVLFRASRHVVGKDGTKNEPPVAYDKYGKLLTCNIGNGSTVEVAFKVFKFKRIKGCGADLMGVKVIDLVPYENDVTFDFETPEVEPNIFDIFK